MMNVYLVAFQQYTQRERRSALGTNLCAMQVAESLGEPFSLMQGNKTFQILYYRR